MKVYFPDTNFFFECRKATDLPWHELEKVPAAQVSDIRLIVPSPVVTEVERHKSKGNSRTARRAREASALLRQALESGGKVELRAAKPRITLELPPVIKPDFSTFPNLDPAKADHQIVVEYAALVKEEPTLTVLSDDTLLVLAMRSQGFTPILIPEGWRLDPEKDERDDKIDKLRAELKGYRQASPDVVVAFQAADGRQLTALDAEVLQVRPSIADIDAIVASIKERDPIEQDFLLETPPATRYSFGPLHGKTWWTPEPEAIEAYKADYNKWLKIVRDRLSGIAAQFNEFSREVAFRVVIANNGFANATDARLTVTAFDGVLLLNSLDDDDLQKRAEKLLLPKPPKAPRGHFADVYGALAPPRALNLDIARRYYDSPALRNIRPRDANMFYYVGGTPTEPVEQLELECRALPHQVEPHTLTFRAVLPKRVSGIQPRLRARLQASNLKKPIEEYVPVTATEKLTNFADAIADVSRKFGEVLRKTS